jgi:hypothetical protein
MSEPRGKFTSVFAQSRLIPPPPLSTTSFPTFPRKPFVLPAAQQILHPSLNSSPPSQMTTTTVTTRRSQPPRSNPVRRQRAKTSRQPATTPWHTPTATDCCLPDIEDLSSSIRTIFDSPVEQKSKCLHYGCVTVCSKATKRPRNVHAIHEDTCQQREDGIPLPGQ